MEKNTLFYFIFGALFNFLARIKYAFELEEDEQPTVQESKTLSIKDIGMLNALTIGWIGRILFSFAIDRIIYDYFKIIFLFPYVIYSVVAGSYTILLAIYLHTNKNISDTKDTKNLVLALIAVLITILALFC